MQINDDARNAGMLRAISDAMTGLQSIQSSFDRYQTAFFPARPPEFFALELAGEAGEVANNEKKLWKGREILAGSIADEAADVFIALINYSNSRGVDLAEAVRTKLSVIDTVRAERAEQGLDY